MRGGFCHSLLPLSPALLLSHTPHQLHCFHLLLSPAHHLQSSQLICSLTPLTLCQIVFALMPDSPAFVSGLLPWYRPDSPPTFASRLSPGKSTSLLSSTTSIACLLSVRRQSVAGWHSACSCSAGRSTASATPRQLLTSGTVSLPDFVSRSGSVSSPHLYQLPGRLPTAVSLRHFPSNTLVEPVENCGQLTAHEPHCDSCLPCWSCGNVLAYHTGDRGSNPAIPTDTELCACIYLLNKSCYTANLVHLCCNWVHPTPVTVQSGQLWTQHTIPHHLVASRLLRASCNMKPDSLLLRLRDKR